MVASAPRGPVLLRHRSVVIPTVVQWWRFAPGHRRSRYRSAFMLRQSVGRTSARKVKAVDSHQGSPNVLINTLSHPGLSLERLATLTLWSGKFHILNMTEIPDQFRHHQIPKTNEDGSVRWRQLHIPMDDLMAEHHRKLSLMNSWDIPMPHATGGLPGRTLIDNVLPHADNKVFYMLDLQDAFSHVNIDTLVDIAKSPIVPRRHEDELEDFIRTQASSEQLPGLPQLLILWLPSVHPE